MEIKQQISIQHQSMMKVRKNQIKQIDMNQIDLEELVKEEEEEEEEEMIEASWEEIENSLELTAQLIGFGSIKKTKTKKKKKFGKKTKTTTTKKKKKVNMEGGDDKQCWKVMAKLNGFLRLICKSNLKMTEPQTPPLEDDDQELEQQEEGRLQAIERERESTQVIDSIER